MSDKLDKRVIFENKHIRISVVAGNPNAYHYYVEQIKYDVLGEEKWDLLLTAYYELAGHCVKEVYLQNNSVLEKSKVIEQLLCNILYDIHTGVQTGTK